MSKKKKSPSPQAYALISLVSFIIGIVLLLLFVFKAEELISRGINEKVFYILLLPMALSAAAFLFGVLRSYAKYRGKILGGILELGGPIVLFLLVIILGFKLVPDTAPFDFTIFLRDSNGETPIGLKGQVKIRISNDLKIDDIDENGEVNFKNIPPKFKNVEIPIEIDISGWQFANQKRAATCTLKGNNVTITIEKDELLCCISGRVIAPDGNFVAGAKVIIKNIEAQTDENGWFTIKIPPGKQEKKQLLIVQKEGYETWRSDVYPELRHEIPIKLTKK